MKGNSMSTNESDIGKFPARGSGIHSIRRNLDWLRQHPLYGEGGKKKLSEFQRQSMVLRFSRAIARENLKHKKESKAPGHGAQGDPATGKVQPRETPGAPPIPPVKERCKCWLCS